MTRYTDASQLYYSDFLLKQHFENVLVAIRRRRIDDFGKQLPTSNMTKAALLAAIKGDDRDFIGLRYKRLSDANRSTVEKWTAVSGVVNFNEVASEIEGLEVTRDMLVDFGPGRMIRKPTMQACVNLMTERARRFAHAHFSSNKHRLGRHYRHCKSSLYLGALTFDLGFADGSPSWTAVKDIFTAEALNFHRIFFTIHGGGDLWSLLVINLAQRNMVYFDPLEGDTAAPLTQSIAAIVDAGMVWLRGAQQQALSLNPTAQRVVSDTVSWPLTRCGSEFPVSMKDSPMYQAVVNEFDAGICVMFAMELIDHDMPVCYWLNALDVLRLNYCYWVLNACLPI
jgi:hypothetical protein